MQIVSEKIATNQNRSCVTEEQVSLLRNSFSTVKSRFKLVHHLLRSLALKQWTVRVYAARAWGIFFKKWSYTSWTAATSSAMWSSSFPEMER